MATREPQQVFRSARDAGPHLITFLFLSLRTKVLEAKIYSGRGFLTVPGCCITDVRENVRSGLGQLARDENL